MPLSRERVRRFGRLSTGFERDDLVITFTALLRRVDANELKCVSVIRIKFRPSDPDIPEGGAHPCAMARINAEHPNVDSSERTFPELCKVEVTAFEMQFF